MLKIMQKKQQMNTFQEYRKLNICLNTSFTITVIQFDLSLNINIKVQKGANTMLY